MDFKVDEKYDSHVHFFGTGIPAIEWDFFSSAGSLPTQLSDKDFIRGFGWKETSDFENVVHQLPQKMFFLSKNDGHTAFISKDLALSLELKTDTLQKVKNLGFIVFEETKDHIERLLPKRSSADLEKMALYSQELFLKEGFQKVRHLTCTPPHWNILLKMSQENSLKLEIECFFCEFMGQNFSEALSAFKQAKQSPAPQHITPKGLKFFYDGSFGSKTAYSILFPQMTPRLEYEQLKQRMESCLDLGCDIAVHTIGEKAVEETLQAFSEVYTKESLTRLHLEHCPAFLPDLLSVVKSLPVTLHFQPSHWRGDKKFLLELSQKGMSVYPFKKLHEMNIPFYFGSDSPVTPPSQADTRECVKEILHTLK